MFFQKKSAAIAAKLAKLVLSLAEPNDSYLNLKNFTSDFSTEEIQIFDEASLNNRHPDYKSKTKKWKNKS